MLYMDGRLISAPDVSFAGVTGIKKWVVGPETREYICDRPPRGLLRYQQ